MTSYIEYQCNNCGHEGLNTRAVPDVPELVRYAPVVGADGRLEKFEQGPYVRYDQAAAMIAELKRRNREIELEHTGVRNSYYDERRKVVALEAKLAQIKAQEPVKGAALIDGQPALISRTKPLPKGAIPLFAAPVDQTAEIERYREQYREAVRNAFKDPNAALSGKEPT